MDTSIQPGNGQEKYPACPTLDRMKEIQPISNSIGDFLIWLQGAKGFCIMEERTFTEEFDGKEYRKTEWVPVMIPIEKLLAEYFEIDL